MTSRPVNFAAGPSTLPLEVLEQAREGLINWQGTGLSVMEMPFTSSEFNQILEQMLSHLAELIKLPPDYNILLLQGGAYGQFAILPMNLMGTVNRADYVISGHWSKRAAKEAERYGHVNIVSDNSDSNFTLIKPFQDWQLNQDTAYCHITTNETANGMQFHSLPDTGTVPLVADVTSDFLTSTIDISRFGALYASAQKNIGIAGLTIVIIHKDLIRDPLPITPTVFTFSHLLKSNLKVNTLPTWAIYISGLLFQWILNEGGLHEMERRNKRKARLLYDVIDLHPIYYCPVAPSCRSNVNVIFNLPTKILEALFLKNASERGFINLQGHPASGGIRVSLYNAIEQQALEQLTDFMHQFAEFHTNQTDLTEQGFVQ